MNFIQANEKINEEKSRLNKMSNRMEKAHEIVNIYKSFFKVEASDMSLNEAISEIAKYNVYHAVLI